LFDSFNPFKESDMERKEVRCADCGAVCPPPGPQGVASGYAVTHDDRKICYRCADNLERLALHDATQFVGYVSNDNRLTTWTGGTLGTILTTRATTIFGHDGYAYRIRDVFGRIWTGRHAGFFAGRGCALKVRRS
jgi:hypothetical protein